MKRFESCWMMRSFLVLVFLSVGLWGRESEAQFPQVNDYQRALRVISEKVHDRFPYLEGEIVAVKGGDIYLSFGQKEKAAKGVKLSVLRKGAPFKHPVTGQVLGTLEEEIGVAEIIDVREKFSVARMTKLTIGKDLVPKVKDKVRLSSAKIRLSVIPFINSTKEAFSTEVLTRDLARVLLSKGRFDVYDVDQLQVWLLDSGIAVDDILKGQNAVRLKKQTRRELVMVNEIREVKKKKFLSSRIVELSTRREVFKAVAIADELPFEQRAPREQALRRGGGGAAVGVPGAPNQSFITNKTGIPGSRGNVSNFLFNGEEFRSVVIADVNKDGKNEVVVSTNQAVIVYQIGNNRMRELARFDEGAGNDFRWMDVGDMNGNGIPEIYLANYRGDDLLSVVLEMKGKGFVKLVKNRRVFFRLVKARRGSRDVKLSDKEAYLLLGQYQGTEEPLNGPVMRFRWAGKKRLRQVAPYLLPENFQIVGFTLWDLEGDGSPEVVELGDDDYLRLYSRRGEVRHKTSTRYGAPVSVKFTNEDEPVEGADQPLLPIRTRLLVEDIDGDGVQELLTVANEYAATRIAPGLGISAGSLVSLVWDGSGLSEVWRSQKVNGGIADFAYGDANNDGVKDLVAITVGTDQFFAKVKSTIYLYRLGN